MKIYSLEFISTTDGTTERIWHTNRRALERYSRTLRRSNFEVHDIKTFDMPSPLTDARVVAFLNAHCSDFMPPNGRAQRAPDTRRGETGSGA